MDVALDDPDTRERIRVERLRGIVALVLGLIVIVIADALDGDQAPVVGGCGFAVAVLAVMWLRRTLLVAAVLRRTPWQRPSVSFPRTPGFDGQFVKVDATDGDDLYMRSLARHRGGYPVLREREPWIAGLPGKRIILAVSGAGPFFLFHRPGLGAERGWAPSLSGPSPDRREFRADALELRQVELRRVRVGYDVTQVEAFLARCVQAMEERAGGARAATLAREVRDVTFSIRKPGFDPDQLDELLDAVHEWCVRAST